MKKIVSVLILLCMLFPLSSLADDDTVVIYTSLEEYRVEHLRKRLQEQFPEYTVLFEYLSSGTHGARLMAEGANTECDISVDLEYGYIDKVKPNFAELSDYDLSVFIDDMIEESNRVMPHNRNGGCIAINRAVLEEKGVAVPTSYQDLLKPEYKGLISMPNPKSSGTGYMFLKSLVNAWGETEAFDYFDALTPNILQYTSSGSGPVNALLQGEVGVGLAMIAQAVTEINNGADLEILFFEEGAPFVYYGMGMIEGKQDRQAVRDVFSFFYDHLIAEDKALFFPEKIYKDKDFEIENYPTGIHYADMSNNTSEEKERLLENWIY